MRTKILLTLTVLLLLTSCDSSIDVGCDVTELIDAINTANSDSNHTTINLDDSCLYNLTAVDNYIDHSEGFSGEDGGTGLPPITTQITIEGNDATIQRLVTASPPDFRIFFVTHTGDLTLNDLSMFNGSIQGDTNTNLQGFGGGIYVNEGVLTLNRSHVMYNFAEDGGGGIMNAQGTVNIHNSSISFNETNSSGGAIFNGRDSTVFIDGYSIIVDNSAVRDGGAINNRGELTILFSHVSRNEAGGDGGAIESLGVLGPTTLTLDDVTFEGNLSYENGGAINLYETAFTITNCTFLNNQAPGTYPNYSWGGAIFTRNSPGTIGGGSLFDGNYTGGAGGAIWNGNNNPGEMVTIQDTTIQNNSTETHGGGVSTLGDLLIVNSTITGNAAQTEGGGVRVQGELTIQDSTISDNSSVMYGGGLSVVYGTITITGSTIQGNQTSGFGGGLSASFSTVTINGSSIFDGNTAQTDGGGIFNGQDSTLLLEDSTVANNHAVDTGGGIVNSHAAEMTISESTIMGNTADQFAGGVSNRNIMVISHSTINNNTATIGIGGVKAGILTMTNSTVSGNQADYIGGIDAGTNTIIVHSTIVHNTATSASWGGVSGHTSSFLTITNSIVAFNTPVDCDIIGTLNAADENLDSDGTCTGFTITADPLIGPLADNSGPTFTHALLASSPALDAAINCPVTVDQRYASRLPGPECDLGAYEDSTIFIPPPPPPPMISITPTPPVYWCEDILGITILEGGIMRIQISTPGLPAGSYNATVGQYDFTCQTYYDEYPDRLFCDGPKGEGGTMTTLTIYNPLGIPFCEETFSIPAHDIPDKPDEQQGCHSGLSQTACIAAGGKWNISTFPASCDCP